MIAKALLPRFGGSNLVWGACMVFFQGMLLSGYVYAHSVQRKLGVYKYAKLHWILLFAPVLFFPFKFGSIISSISIYGEVFTILKLLTLMISLPFITLSTTSLVLQRWLSISKTSESENPYVLYSASNLGSLIALITYPVLFEPFFTLKEQGNIWWSCYIFFIILNLLCFPVNPDEQAKSSKNSTKTSPLSIFIWGGLSCGACAILLATTNIITFDVASVPFLWVMPLSIYLLTFILTFKKKCWYPKCIPLIAYWSMTVGTILYFLSRLQSELPVAVTIFLYLIILFIVCLYCHGTLISLRPKNTHSLTSFYVSISFGGLIGTVLVSYIVPELSTSPIEYLIAFFIISSTFGIIDHFLKKTSSISDISGKISYKKKILITSLWIISVIFTLTFLPYFIVKIYPDIYLITIQMLLAIPLCLILRGMSRRPWKFAVIMLSVIFLINQTPKYVANMSNVIRVRNFYGIYTIFERNNLRILQHGTVHHGKQYIKGPKKEIPLSYYHPSTPAGEILKKRFFECNNVGMIGLGTGAMAAYFQKGNSFTIYELDPDNIKIAKKYFSFLRDAEKRGVDLKYVSGDGRRSLKKEPDKLYDLLIIDAFSSDSIPVHLMTVEAISEYFRVLKEDGLLLMHISNKMLHLEPVVFSIAQVLNIPIGIKTNFGKVDEDADLTVWVALSKDVKKMNFLFEKLRWNIKNENVPGLPRPWTDQYSNIFKAMF